MENRYKKKSEEQILEQGREEWRIDIGAGQRRLDDRYWRRVGKNGGQILEQGREEWMIDIGAGQGRMEDRYWIWVEKNG